MIKMIKLEKKTYVAKKHNPKEEGSRGGERTLWKSWYRLLQHEKDLKKISNRHW